MMERLTKHTPDDFGYFEYVLNSIKDEYDCVQLLGQYEDTGFTPEEIQQLQTENERLKAERDKAVEDMAFNAGDGGCWKTCATHYCSTCNNGDNFKWRGLENNNNEMRKFSAEEEKQYSTDIKGSGE